MADAELHLPADVRYVGLARMVVCAAARQEGMDEERVEDLRIAVSEATTNAVVTRNGNGAGQPVVLHFGPGPGGFVVTVRDTGPWAAATPAATSQHPDIPDPGLAVTLVRGLADEVELVPADSGRVHMRFRLSLDVADAADAADDADGSQDGQPEPRPDGRSLA